MANAINEFLVGLLNEEAPQLPALTTELRVISAQYGEEEDYVKRILGVCRNLELAKPSVDFEVVDPDSGELQAMADLAWPEGVQVEMTEPVAFLAERDAEMEERLSELGYRFFADESKLVGYLEELVGVDIDGDGQLGEPSSEPGSRASTPPDAAEARAGALGEMPEPDEAVRPLSAGAQAAAEAELDQLEREWHRRMASIYQRAITEAGYRATYFAQMLGEHGGLRTARRLLLTKEPSEGFVHLWERNRLDLTVEAHVLNPRFAPLFADEERRIARDRLAQYGFDDWDALRD